MKIRKEQKENSGECVPLYSLSIIRMGNVGIFLKDGCGCKQSWYCTFC